MGGRKNLRDFSQFLCCGQGLSPPWVECPPGIRSGSLVAQLLGSLCPASPAASCSCYSLSYFTFSPALFRPFWLLSAAFPTLNFLQEPSGMTSDP